MFDNLEDISNTYIDEKHIIFPAPEVDVVKLNTDYFILHVENELFYRDKVTELLNVIRVQNVIIKDQNEKLNIVKNYFKNKTIYK